MAKRIRTIEDLPPDFKVRHIMADGTVLDSIEGMVIPYAPETKLFYELIAKYS